MESSLPHGLPSLVCARQPTSSASPSSRGAPGPRFCLPAYPPFTPQGLVLIRLRGGHPDKLHPRCDCIHGRLGKLRPGAWEGLALVWWEWNPAFSAVDTCSLTSLACHTYTPIHMERPALPPQPETHQLYPMATFTECFLFTQHCSQCFPISHLIFSEPVRRLLVLSPFYR